MKWFLLLIVFVVLIIAFLLSKKQKEFICLGCDYHSKQKFNKCPICGFVRKGGVGGTKGGSGGGYDG